MGVLETKLEGMKWGVWMFADNFCHLARMLLLSEARNGESTIQKGCISDQNGFMVIQPQEFCAKNGLGSEGLSSGNCSWNFVWGVSAVAWSFFGMLKLNSPTEKDVCSLL